MKEQNPLVSVIIPVYNGERFLAEAIESVLRQTYSPVEIIVIDDGSEDHSAQIAQRYREVRYFHQPNSGLSEALNHGVRQARGSFLSFLDADDLWTDDKLMLQVTMMKRDQEVEAVFGHHVRFYTGTPNQAGDDPTVRHDDRVLPALFKGAMLVRKEAFDRVGFFDTSLVMGDFLDWYQRAQEKGLKSRILPEVIFRRRIHGDNKSVRDRHAMKDYVRIVKAALDRRRGNNDTRDEEK
jgi:glycosyltransferase involved in cell wall biosynthesis